MGAIVAIEFECRKQYNIEEHARAHKTLAGAIAMESSHPQQQFYLIPWAWNYLGHHRVESKQPRSRLATLYRLYCFCVIDVFDRQIELVFVMLTIPAVLGSTISKNSQQRDFLLFKERYDSIV